MRYQNMKIETPPVGSIAPAERDFMLVWDTMIKNRQALENILRPGLNAIKKYHYPHGDHSILFDTFELYEAAGGLKSIVYCLQDHVNGSIHDTNFSIPLTAVLAGEEAVLAFFIAEKAKQEEKAREMGKARALREKGDRRKLFDELKLEFEPRPPLRGDELVEYGR